MNIRFGLFGFINHDVLRKTFLLISTFMCAITVFAQGEIKILGTVTDDAGAPMPGVNVLVKGTMNGVVTDVDGKYSINVHNDAVLVFSFIGYVTYEQSVGNQTALDVKMSEDTQQIEEVVVLGYGTQKKVTLTGSISSINTNELLKAPVPNIGHALAGNLPGLSAIQYSGQPGADDPTIFIRGIGSLDATRAAPLFMVDGVERSFFRLDPNEIENITVLKDASATAVFGVRGANGVILVTTKRGQVGKPKISVSTSAGIQRPLRVLDYAGSYDYALMYNEAQRNDGIKEEDLVFKPQIIEAFRTNSDPLLYPNTDWMDMIMKPAAFQSQHNINISGGTDQVRFFTSIGVITQDGIFRSFDEGYNANFTYNRYNYRANLDIDVTPTTLMKINLGGRVEDTHEPNYKGNSLSDFYSALTLSLPFAGVGLYDGKWVRAHPENVPFPEGPLENGDMFETYYGRGFNSRIRNEINLDLSLTQKLDVITKGLSFTVKGSYNSSYTHRKYRTKSMPYYTAHRDESGQLFFRKRREETVFGFSESMGKTRDWYLEGSFNYARSFGKHNVSALALYNQWRDPYPDANKYNYPNIPRGYVGLVGRVTYDFSMRYMLDFNVGYNGSENFAPGKRYGLFPALSGGWIISEESFMQDVTFIDYLKLRASYGIVGNDISSKSRFFYLPDSYNPNAGGYNFGTNISANQPFAVEQQLGNKEVSWEKARKQNYGVDFSVLGSRLSGSFDYFIEKRNDILTTRNTVPAFIAVSMPVVNIGKVENKGFEAVLKWNHKIREFRYFISANVSFAKNTVVYKDEIPHKYDWRYETGKPVGQQFGYIFDGFATEAELASGKLPDQKLDLHPGDSRYRDLNNDEVIDDNDIAAIGYPKYPQLAGGVSLGFEYKNFDFSMMWAGASRVSRFISDALRVPFGITKQRSVLKYMIDDHWTPETAATAKTPRLSFNHLDNNYLQNSTLWLKDASYLRLKNLQIGYTFRGGWLQKAHIENMRLFATGENLITLDKLKISDPEATDGGSFNYPLMMVINLGLSITF